MTDDENWISPSEALHLLKSVGHPSVIATAILARLGGGIIRSNAEARLAYRHGRQFEHAAQIDLEQSLWFVGGHNATSSFWQTGDATFSVHVGQTEVIYQAFGIRFWKPDILKMLPTHQSNSASTSLYQAPAPRPNGRPPKAYWEPLLIEMARQLYAGELCPKSQADVQRAMHDWLASNGHSAGEPQVKARARQLWTAIQ